MWDAPLERAAQAVGKLLPMDRDEADEIVIAVLKAIREPSNKMMLATQTFDPVWLAKEDYRLEAALMEAEGAKETWQAMIDAALSDNG